MTKPNEGQVVNDESRGETRSKRKEFGADDFAELNDLGDDGPRVVLRESEKEFLRELVLALRTIRYGSIVLTVHEGQLVEINKSVRIRKGRPNQKD